MLAAGYKFIYGDKGIVTGFLLALFPGMDPAWFSGFFAVLAVMTFAATTNHMLFVANALKGVDYQTIEAAGTWAPPPGRSCGGSCCRRSSPRSSPSPFCPS